jgi:hypothetical protein
MGLVTLARYRTITLDTTSKDAAVTAALEDSQDLIEEYLRRPLESVSRTEDLKIDGDERVYPLATPVTVVATPAGLDIKGNGRWLEGASPDASKIFDPEPVVTVTYTGGFTTATVPETIERGIAWLAWVILHERSSEVEIPAGATSVRLGDASVNFEGGYVPGTILPSGLRRKLTGYRRR